MKKFERRGRPKKFVDWHDKFEVLNFLSKKYPNFRTFKNCEKAKLANDLLISGVQKPWIFEILELKRTTFLYWNKPNEKQKQDENDIDLILKSFNKNLKQFGYRRLTQDLRENGITFNHKKVLRLMNKFCVRANYVKKMMRKAKKRTGKINRYPDLIQRRFKEIVEPLTVLYTDVTYLIHEKKHAYQSTVIDGATREIIDFKISYKNDNNLVLSNLRDTIDKIKKIKSPNGIIIHSDHGYQYTSNEFKHFCDSDNLIISQGKAYTCTDNIVIESFHALLKKGTKHNNKYGTLEEYIEDVKRWNIWYNEYKKSNFTLIF